MQTVDPFACSTQRSLTSLTTCSGFLLILIQVPHEDARRRLPPLWQTLAEMPHPVSTFETFHIDAFLIVTFLNNDPDRIDALLGNLMDKVRICGVDTK